MNAQINHPDLIKLQQYADAMLDADAHARVEHHLADCASCRNALRIERSLSEAIRAMPSPSPSPRFDGTVLAAVRRPVGSRTQRTPYVRYAAAALLIITTFVVVIIAGASGETQSQSLLTPVFEQITGLLSPAVDLLTRQSEKLTPHLDNGESSFLRIFFLATAALLIIGGLERLFFPSFRHGHKT